jgi:hypothetical protein
MMNLTLTQDGEVIKGIFRYMSNEHGLQAQDDNEAKAIMLTYLDLFIDEYGVDLALEDGLLVPTECVA